MNIEPIKNYLLVREYKPKKTKGLVKPENEFDKQSIADILAIGPEVEGFKKGEIIIYEEFTGIEIEKEQGLIDENVILISANRVLAKIKKGK